MTVKAERGCTPNVAPACCRHGQAVLDSLHDMQLFLEAWGRQQEERLEDNLAKVRAELRGVFPESRTGASQGQAEAADSSRKPRSRLASLSIQATPEALLKTFSRSNTSEPRPVGVNGHLNPVHYVSEVFAKSSKFSSKLIRKLTQYLYEEPLPPDGYVRRWICSNKFEFVCGCIISINACFMGFSGNYDALNLPDSPPDWQWKSELAFCCIYSLELCLRVYARGARYLLCPDWKWNFFDVLLVLASLHEQVTFLTSRLNTSNLSFLRALRISKMARVLRMVRLMHIFREFRMLLNSIGGSMKAVFWALALLTVSSYMFGLCILQGVTSYLTENPHVDQDIQENLRYYWGSVPLAMLSLYKATTGGLDWDRPGDILQRVGTVYYSIFLIYIALYTCVIMNTVTSLFVESTIALAEKDTASIIYDRMSKQDEYIRKLRSWFNSIDGSDGGTITFEQFSANANDPDVLAFAQTLDIELLDLKQFFAVISGYGRRPVNLENFVLGCIKLKGMAKSMDLMSLMYSHRDATLEQKDMLMQFEKECMRRLSEVKSLFGDRMANVGVVAPSVLEEEIGAKDIEEAPHPGTLSGTNGSSL